MPPLSANKAAKEAGIAKKTLLDSIRSGRVSATKNSHGHWEIEPSELFRVFPKTTTEPTREPTTTPPETNTKIKRNSALEVEVSMLREQIRRIDTERDREREQLSNQIEALKEQAERQSADYRQALAMLTDQREKPPVRPVRGFWSRFKR